MRQLGQSLPCLLQRLDLLWRKAGGTHVDPLAMRILFQASVQCNTADVEGCNAEYELGSSNK
jgi:hypothetical protein